VHRNEKKRRGKTNHGITEAPKAETTSTSTGAHAVLSRTIAPIAALGCWGGAVVPFAAAVVVGVADVGGHPGADGLAAQPAAEEVVTLRVDAPAVETTVELAAEVRPAVVALAEVDAEGPLRYAGGGTALEGSFNAPVPHGMASPLPGWTALGGGTVAPSAPAMAKRVVQVLVLVRGEENW